jgi:pyrroloquinoline quinone biosynthesis protein E
MSRSLADHPWSDGRSQPHLAEGVRLHWDRHDQRSILLHPEGVLRPSETGLAILALCDGRRSVDEIAAVLAGRYTRKIADVRRDLIEFLDEMYTRILIRVPVGDEALDGLAEGATVGSDPPVAASTIPRPLGLVAELTYGCPLHCPYCSNPTRYPPTDRELRTEDWQRVFAEAASIGMLHALLSGGEPLLRPDLPELVAAAHAAGLYTNLITSGVGLTPERLGPLKAAGLDSVQISLQADEESLANEIAGSPAHAAKLRAARLVRAHRLPLTINVVIHRHNIDRIDRVIALAEALDAHRLELANVQYYGWASRNQAALLPGHEQVARAAALAAEAGTRLRGRMTILYIRPDYFDNRPKPCLGGWGRRYLTVNPVGDVLPCPTAGGIAELSFDNVRSRPLARIWAESEAFNRFRGTAWMAEPCRGCPLREVDFGGCRCQAALFTGNAANTDPVCDLSPHHGALPFRHNEGPPPGFLYRTNPKRGPTVYPVRTVSPLPATP